MAVENLERHGRGSLTLHQRETSGGGGGGDHLFLHPHAGYEGEEGEPGSPGKEGA